jgi:hypothetical protein
MKTAMALGLAIALGTITLILPAAAEPANPWAGWSGQQSTITNPGLSGQQPVGADQWAAWGSRDRRDDGRRDDRDGRGDWRWDGRNWHRGYWPGPPVVVYPNRGYVWMPGYWSWTGYNWVWIPGYWAR